MAADFALLEIFADNDIVLPFTVADVDADPTLATPKNITGYTVRWALARQKDGTPSRDYVVAKDNGSTGGVSIVSGAAGTLEVTLDASDTIDLRGDFYQELEVVDGAGKKLVVGTGDVTIKLNVRNP